MGTLPQIDVVLDTQAPRALLSATLTRAIEASPSPPWLLAHGPGAAVAHWVTTRALGLRIAGGIFIEPRAWQTGGAQIDVGEDPLPYPAIVFCAEPARFPSGWQARLVLAQGSADAFDHPLLRAMVAHRSALLRQTGALREG